MMEETVPPPVIDPELAQKYVFLKPVPFEDKQPIHVPTSRLPLISQQNLILGSLSGEFIDAQLNFPTLERYSQAQLKNEFKKILQEPPNEIPSKIPVQIPFTADEDIILYAYIRNNENKTVDDLIQQFNSFFFPCRSKSEIENRIKELSESQNGVDSIIEDLVNQIITEDVFYLSASEQTDEMKKLKLTPSSFVKSRCQYQTHKPHCILNDIESEMEKLVKSLPLLVDSCCTRNDLAILRSENTTFYMRREAILFGRQSDVYDVDVDLSFDDERTCPHISNLAAVLFFREDLNFYIENIAFSKFRVNGVKLETNDVCRIKEGDILDFSGKLMMFLPNKSLIAELKAYMDNPPLLQIEEVDPSVQPQTIV